MCDDRLDRFELVVIQASMMVALEELRARGYTATAEVTESVIGKVDRMIKESRARN